ncbi:hypothetical protein [Streptomyces sp. NPDC058268]|uniref:hypothetical protein n=1 Tax=Streptomyces sp. NPDC058268 TaxID=3346413 RepID=UPI0036F0AB17
MTINEPFQPLTAEQRSHIAARCREFISLKAQLQGVPNKDYVDIFANLARSALGALVQGVAGREVGKHFTLTAFINARDGRLSATIAGDGTSLYGDDDVDSVATLITAARAAYHQAFVVVRTTEPDGSRVLRAWKLVDGHPLPLPADAAARMCTREQVDADAYTDAFDIAPLFLRVP